VIHAEGLAARRTSVATCLNTLRSLASVDTSLGTPLASLLHSISIPSS
jgi:hypothetical protein